MSRAHTREPTVDYPTLPIAEVLRSVRRWSRQSQRDVARRAGLPHVTVARLEAGHTRDPSVSTLERVLGANDFYLQVVSDPGGPLFDYYHPDGEKRDRGGRHFPAHLQLRRPADPYCGVYDDEWWWWGWYRLAWRTDDPAVPEWTFTRHREATRLQGDEPLSSSALTSSPLISLPLTSSPWSRRCRPIAVSPACYRAVR